MFAITTLAAILAALARWADNGSDFAIGMMTAFGFLGVCFIGFVVLFLIGWAAVIHRIATRIVAVNAGALLVGSASFVGPSQVISIIMLIAGIFFLVSGFTLFLVSGPDDVPTPTSPFAADQLPPQILPPREPTK